MAVIKDIDESQAPLLDHLIELRGRLVRCVLALALAFGLCLYFADPILGFLIQPTVVQHVCQRRRLFFLLPP